jgi:hypothetical protein
MHLTPMFITLDKSYDVRHTTYRVNDKFQQYNRMGIDVDTFYYIICDDGSEKVLYQPGL